VANPSNEHIEVAAAAGRAASDPDHDQQVRARLDRAARRRRGARHRGS